MTQINQQAQDKCRQSGGTVIILEVIAQEVDDMTSCDTIVANWSSSTFSAKRLVSADEAMEEICSQCASRFGYAVGLGEALHDLLASRKDWRHDFRDSDVCRTAGRACAATKQDHSSEELRGEERCAQAERLTLKQDLPAEV